MTIVSKTLRFLRQRVPMSQDQLAKASGVSKKTIARIETDKSTPNTTTVKRLAIALRVRPDDLAKEPSESVDQERRLRESGYLPLKEYIDGKTAVAFQMVELLYDIPVRSQVVMAPLFAALLAEGSLSWRQRKLAEVDDAVEKLKDLATGHLSFANVVHGVDDPSHEERSSIRKRDLFGNHVSDETFELGFDPTTHNPFADYLREMASKFDPSDILIDGGEEGIWKTPEGMPDYWIARRALEIITGGDLWAEYALTHGYTKLADIPKEILKEEAKDDRIAWLAAKVPQAVKAEEEARFQNLIKDLDL